MARSVLAGSRIRDYRIGRGLRQADLAKACGISPSYLNLIEHNRRKIGGALLVRIARALGAEPAILSEGAESALTMALDAAAGAYPDTNAERERAEEMAGRFPGWARLIERQYREARRLEQVIERLDDRLTHDPFLSASMHSVLSSVTAIRSASAILANGENIEPEWQARFHRNIYEDSQRLADATEGLVSYLDAGDSEGRAATLPQEEVEIWLAARDWRVDVLEENPDADVAPLIGAPDGPATPAGRALAVRALTRYADDARALPAARLSEAMERITEPSRLASALGVPLATVYRRLAALPAVLCPDGTPWGLVACDGSGTLIFRKPLPGFDVPRYGAACPLWPLFRALQRPMALIRERVAVSGRNEGVFDAEAISDIAYPVGFDGPAVVEAWMLLRARLPGDDAGPALKVGASCRICAVPDCPARREPSVFALPDEAG
ncbi:XRE family transcriptional regulator [Silicimonas algicola]|uniref:HTH cro/C1-type domain-containing protein n=1 Tax=Silicimonas algicola TaxID=1826607 RepID=A0A316G822_9RHOB|nr:XRE family transcriptional regulator [Silicimonas algicola]AZQ67425.1 XRE family transcriptional regulator [Silicimonas algicola]PWK57111.1 hypothetical protein C8D95_103349 [Silicimonas algicola]